MFREVYCKRFTISELNRWQIIAFKKITILCEHGVANARTIENFKVQQYLAPNRS